MPIDKSSVLILAVCSNRKTRQGESPQHQASARTIGQGLPADYAGLLFEGRRRILDLITSGRASRDGEPLSDFLFNAELVEGPDFRLTHSIRGGRYLPAAQRYRGRFYDGLGPNVAALLANTRHHVLIVSALYGLVTPAEPIQIYDCHAADQVDDSGDIRQYWTGDDLLTRVLEAYVRKFGITKIFDFIASEAHRDLISWEMLRNATGGVLHPVSKHYGDDAVLPSLGVVTRYYLNLAEDHLVGIQPGKRVGVGAYADELVFCRVRPGDDVRRRIARALAQRRATAMLESSEIAQELHDKVTIQDKIGRMRRNIIKMFRVLLYSDLSFGGLVREMERSGHYRVAGAIGSFAALRNDVEYRGYVPTRRDREQVKRCYNTIEHWAGSSGFPRGMSLEPV